MLLQVTDCRTGLTRQKNPVEVTGAMKAMVGDQGSGGGSGRLTDRPTDQLTECNMGQGGAAVHAGRDFPWHVTH